MTATYRVANHHAHEFARSLPAAGMVTLTYERYQPGSGVLSTEHGISVFVEAQEHVGKRTLPAVDASALRAALLASEQDAVIAYDGGLLVNGARLAESAETKAAQEASAKAQGDMEALDALRFLYGGAVSYTESKYKLTVHHANGATEFARIATGTRLTAYTAGTITATLDLTISFEEARHAIVG